MEDSHVVHQKCNFHVLVFKNENETVNDPSKCKSLNWSFRKLGESGPEIICFDICLARDFLFTFYLRFQKLKEASLSNQAFAISVNWGVERINLGFEV